VEAWSTSLSAGAAEILGRELSSHELDAFSKYLKILMKWQGAQRLVGSAEPGWVVEHLLLDSLLFLGLIPGDARSVLDFGSGAGIPGVPLKIVAPHLRLTLLESRQKRASFLRAVVRELALPDTTVVDARAEKLAEEGARFDAVVMRCAGDLGVTLPLAARLATPDGLVIASGPPEGRRRGSAPQHGGRWVELGRPGHAPRRFILYRTS
jgi:16S rRNA (guanine527-N7)-methyltransferase